MTSLNLETCVQIEINILSEKYFYASIRRAPETHLHILSNPLKYSHMTYDRIGFFLLTIKFACNLQVNCFYITRNNIIFTLFLHYTHIIVSYPLSKSKLV